MFAFVAALAIASPAAPSRPHPPRPRDSVRVLLVTTPTTRGSTASLFAQVSPPSAACVIVVVTKGGPMATDGLSPKHAVRGFVRWTWIVPPTTPIGNARIFVECGSTIAKANLAIVA